MPSIAYHEINIVNPLSAGGAYMHLRFYVPLVPGSIYAPQFALQRLQFHLTVKGLKPRNSDMGP